MRKLKTVPWNIYEFLATEKDVQMFVEASIDEAKNDTDPIYLANALATAAEARRRLAQKGNAVPPPVPALQEAAFNGNPGIRDFDKTAREFGYHVTLSPVV